MIGHNFVNRHCPHWLNHIAHNRYIPIMNTTRSWFRPMRIADYDVVSLPQFFQQIWFIPCLTLGDGGSRPRNVFSFTSNGTMRLIYTSVWSRRFFRIVSIHWCYGDVFVNAEAPRGAWNSIYRSYRTVYLKRMAWLFVGANYIYTHISSQFIPSTNPDSWTIIIHNVVTDSWIELRSFSVFLANIWF